MANTNFTAEQQTAIDNYNTQKQKLSERWLWNTWTQRVALNQLRDTWVGSNANGFFVIESTPTATSGTTTKPTQQVSQNWNNQTVQTTVSNQNNGNNQNQNTIQQQWALKPLSQDYYNQSGADNLSTIVSNLNNYRQTNPEYFTDYDSFKKNFSYDARNDAQKQTLDTWYNGYQRWMELNSKTVSDLATQYKNWLISDSDLEQLRTANQWKYGEVMDYINKQTILSKYDEENTPSASDNPFQAIIDQYYNNLLTASQTNASSEMFENYKNQMNSPEMTEMSDQLADLDGQLKEYQNELNRIKSDVERRYEWTWASKSKINAIIADESYKIQEAMNTASLQYNTLATKYNNRMTQYQNEFQLQLQEYQFNMQQRNQQMQELWFVMDLMNFETNEQKDEREWNNYVRQYDFQYWNINSKDEASRRRAIENAVDSVLTEFSGITMIRSREQMVEDIKNLVDGGMSLWEAITKNIREPIMQKPEYKIWSANKLGTTSWVSIGWVSYNYDANWNLLLDNWINYQNLPDYTAVSQETMNKALTQVQSLWDKSWWWQCGSFVNNYLQDMWIGRLYTDPIEAKKSVTNSTVPSIWSVAVFDWSNNPNASEAQKKYGHVWIVVGIDEANWTITVKESNHWWDEKIYTSTYKMSQVYWYFDPTISKQQAINTVTQQAAQNAQTITQDPYSWISGYTSNWTEINAWWWITSLQEQYKAKWSSADERNKTLSAYWIDEKQYNEQKQKYADYLSKTQLVDNLTELKDTAEELLKRNQTNSSGNVWLHGGRADRQTAERWYWKFWPFEWKTAAAEWVALYNYLKNNETLQKFLDLKANGATFGAMQESEWKMVSSSANNLEWNTTNDTFENSLQKMIDAYNTALSKLWVDVTQSTNQEPDMSELQSQSNINNAWWMYYTDNWTLVKYENWKRWYSYDWWKTWN